MPFDIGRKGESMHLLCSDFEGGLAPPASGRGASIHPPLAHSPSLPSALLLDRNSCCPFLPGKPHRPPHDPPIDRRDELWEKYCTRGVWAHETGWPLDRIEELSNLTCYSRHRPAIVWRACASVWRFKRLCKLFSSLARVGEWVCVGWSDGGSR